TGCPGRAATGGGRRFARRNLLRLRRPDNPLSGPPRSHLAQCPNCVTPTGIWNLDSLLNAAEPPQEKEACSVYRHSLVFAAACLGMLLFGITMTTLGAVLPPLMDRYGMDRTEAGSLLALMSLGILAGSLVFGPIVDRFGYRSVLIAAALGVCLGLEGIAGA